MAKTKIPIIISGLNVARISAQRVIREHQNQFLPGDKSKLVPPDPIPNSEVKQFSANDSVGLSMQKSVIARRLFKNPCCLLSKGFLFCPHPGPLPLLSSYS